MKHRWWGALALGVFALAPSTGGADSFNPVRMEVKIAPVARLHQPLAVLVSVSGDPGVLDVRNGPLRARVKVTGSECGGDFAHTPGTVLLDRSLSPQPDPGEPYQGSARGSGRPSAYGVQTVCVFLEDDYRQFATDTADYQVEVSRPCTLAAARYDRAGAALTQARVRLRHTRGSAARRRLGRMINRQRAAMASAERAARSRCGPGVPL